MSGTGWVTGDVTGDAEFEASPAGPETRGCLTSEAHKLWMQKTKPAVRIAVHAPRQKAEDGEEETDFIFDPPRFDPPTIFRELYTTFAVLPRDVTLLEVVKLFSQVREASSTAGRE
jgi:hypothetical protein